MCKKLMKLFAVMGTTLALAFTFVAVNADEGITPYGLYVENSQTRTLPNQYQLTLTATGDFNAGKLRYTGATFSHYPYVGQVINYGIIYRNQEDNTSIRITSNPEVAFGATRYKTSFSFYLSA